ncbi:MAG TPA: efflux RND transporter permease subunit, partial [Spirochaetota bacterium]|nr:efflux RND transporter permease subunit [Spirochaetota bacterium]
MKEKINPIVWAIKNKQITLFIISMLLLFGLYSLFEMPRQEFPEFTIRQGLVIGFFPGASSGQVESQLTSKVEEYLFSFKEVNRRKTYSISREGIMIVFV